MGTTSTLSSFSLVIYNLIFIEAKKLKYFNRTLSFSSKNEADVIFGTIFVIVWAGAGIVTLNAKLLRGKM